MKPIPLFLGLALAAAVASAQEPAAAKASAVGDAMNQAIAVKEIAGSVTWVGDRKGTLSFEANGSSNLESKTPMAKDALFWIASMTKPVTATSVLMMQEAGKLSVDDPVSKYLPEFKELKDAAGKEVFITIKQCLTHSSGLPDVSAQEGEVPTLSALMPKIVAKPVKFAPDSKWEYCQTGINTAARVVEVVSGETFPEFLSKRLFQPLGMKDTTFYPTPDQVKRLATTYARTAAGELEKAEIASLGKDPGNTNRYPRANGGLFSTADDYSKFARMILNGGELDGKRYLAEASVKQMTTVQSGDLQTGFTPGNAWGLGWCVVKQPQGVSEALSPGSFGHGGVFGTQAWIDPVKGRIYLLFVQRANFPNSDASDVRRAFQKAAAGL